MLVLLPESRTLGRLLIALLVSVFFLMSTMLAKPYRRITDDLLASTAQLMLVCVFLAAMLIQLCQTTLIISAQSTLDSSRFSSTCTAFIGDVGSADDGAYYVSLIILGFNFFMLGVVLTVMTVQMLTARTLATMRIKATGEEPQLGLAKGHRYHLFLSHSDTHPTRTLQFCETRSRSPPRAEGQRRRELPPPRGRAG